MYIRISIYSTCFVLYFIVYLIVSDRLSFFNRLPQARAHWIDQIYQNANIYGCGRVTYSNRHAFTIPFSSLEVHIFFLFFIFLFALFFVLRTFYYALKRTVQHFRYKFFIEIFFQKHYSVNKIQDNVSQVHIKCMRDGIEKRRRRKKKNIETPMQSVDTFQMKMYIKKGLHFMWGNLYRGI